ncbi:PEP-CTERM sorting domain-containing protein [Candidatus Nitrospira salsa]
MKRCLGPWADRPTVRKAVRDTQRLGNMKIALNQRLRGRPTLVVIVGLMLLSVSAGVHAATFGFTDRSAFQSALSGQTSVVNFDDVDAGTSIQDGVPFQGISFTSNVDNIPGRTGLLVSAEFLTTSPLNYLGVNDGFSNEFLFGDELTLNFTEPIRALGLSVIAGPDAALANDFLLTAGGGSVFNVGTPEQRLFDGGEVFFLGLINDQGFSTAQLISFGDQIDSSLGFNIDDISTDTPSNVAPVPEPSAVLLFGTGLLLLGGVARRNRLKAAAIQDKRLQCLESVSSQ